MVNLGKSRNKVTLSEAFKSSGAALSNKIIAGLCWDCNKSCNIDVDVSVFIVNDKGIVDSDDDFIFYNKRSDVGNWNSDEWVADRENSGVYHTGDNRTGRGSGDDEEIILQLDKINNKKKALVFVVTIDNSKVTKQTFGKADNCYISIRDSITGKELIQYSLTDDFSINSSLIVAKLRRNGADWEFEAIGEAINGGLDDLCKKYGVEVE